MTALHFAARNGFKNVVEVLVTNGADINSTNSAGITPLRAVETELQNGENAKEGTVQARIYAAKAQGYKDVIEWLRQHGGRE
jgi:ankyrin repeat protein